MSTEITKTTVPRSGWEFTPRERAYHVYMFTLQKRNYGIGSREYCRQHSINRDTFRGWINRYPQGQPFYDIDNPVNIDAPAKTEPQMIKLSSDQLVPRKDNEITEFRREFNSSVSPVMIKFYDSVISADNSNLSLILSAIKNVSNGQDL